MQQVKEEIGAAKAHQSSIEKTLMEGGKLQHVCHPGKKMAAAAVIAASPRAAREPVVSHTDRASV